MKFYIYTLGCKVNTYESNIMKELLERSGYIYSEDADIYIVNTCTVTNTSDNKSLKLLRRLRREHENAILVAVGCLSQVNPDNIDADIILGNVGKGNIIKYIREYEGKKIVDVRDIMESPFEIMELTNFDKTRAFVKIEDGCENYCSYCIIPYTRGKVRSKKKEDVLKEVKNLISNGHSEIVLTGIHTGHYYDGDYSFYNLLCDLVKIEGLKRLRISSIEITEINVSSVEEVSAFTGLKSNSDVEFLVVAEPMMSSQAFSTVVVKAKDNADIESMKQEMLDNIDMNKWICVSAEKVYVTNSGNVIFMVMSDEEWAKLVYDSFKEQVENKIGKELEKSEDTDYELPPEITGNSVSPVSPILDGTDSVVPPVVDDENNEVTTEASGNLK